MVGERTYQAKKVGTINAGDAKRNLNPSTGRPYLRPMKSRKTANCQPCDGAPAGSFIWWRVALGVGHFHPSPLSMGEGEWSSIRRKARAAGAAGPLWHVALCVIGSI